MMVRSDLPHSLSAMWIVPPSQACYLSAVEIRHAFPPRSSVCWQQRRLSSARVLTTASRLLLPPARGASRTSSPRTHRPTCGAPRPRGCGAWTSTGSRWGRTQVPAPLARDTVDRDGARSMSRGSCSESLRLDCPRRHCMGAWRCMDYIGTWAHGMHGHMGTWAASDARCTRPASPTPAPRPSPHVRSRSHGSPPHEAARPAPVTAMASGTATTTGESTTWL